MAKTHILVTVTAAIALLFKASACEGANDIIPADRVVDWSNAGVVQADGTKGIPHRTTVFASVKDAPYNAAGSSQATTGSTAAGSNQLSVASAIDFAVGQGIDIYGGQGIASLTITSGATQSTNVTVTLSGVQISVAVTAGDTPAQVADKIRNKYHYLFVRGGDPGTATVTFTTASNASMGTPAYSAGTSGAAGTMTSIVQGAADLVTKIIAINGNTLTLATNALGTVTNHTVIHDDTAAIQGAVDACPADQVVFIPPGSYVVSGSVQIKRPLVIRGAGPSLTTIIGNGQTFLFVTPTLPSYYYTKLNVINWTGGYNKGETVITLENTNNLQVGQEIVLDQLNDTDVNSAGYTPITNINGYGEGNIQGVTGNSGASRVGDYLGQSGQLVPCPRVLMQMARITAIGANQVTIDTPLYFTHLASLQPQIFSWPGGNLRYAGIEDLKIDSQYKSVAVRFQFCTNCWVKNIEIYHNRRGAIGTEYTCHLEIRDSFFHEGYSSAPENYVIELAHTSASLIENNIFRHTIAEIMLGLPNQGNVVGYNYIVDHGKTSTGATYWLFGALCAHDAHNYMNLIEGNIAPRAGFDNVWGSGSHMTLFRNRLVGVQEPVLLDGYLWSNGNNPVTVNSWNRFVNIVGNVLGAEGVHRVYEAAGQVMDSYPSYGFPPGCNDYSGNLPCDYGMGVGPVYIIGYANNTSDLTHFDPITVSTLLRWGNYDFATHQTHWDNVEIPAGVPVPATHVLPASLYRASKPSWWGNLPWPAIGPDVNPMAGILPAQKCYEDRNLANGGTFDGAACYGNAASVFYGDVSENGSVSAYDAALAAQYGVGLITLTAAQITKADVSGNGSVTSYDASLIAQYAVGLISKFPVQG